LCTTFGAFDIDLPRTSLEQSQYGTKSIMKMLKRRFNLFKQWSSSSKSCGMVVEVSNGDIKFIHASTSNGVIISSIKENITVKELRKSTACCKAIQFFKRYQTFSY
jgi:cell wall-associated NlpC family hydrolase